MKSIFPSSLEYSPGLELISDLDIFVFDDKFIFKDSADRSTGNNGRNGLNNSAITSSVDRSETPDHLNDEVKLLPTKTGLYMFESEPNTPKPETE